MNAWRNVYPILILFKWKVHIGTYSPVQKSSDKLCSEFTITLVKSLLFMAVCSLFPELFHIEAIKSLQFLKVPKVFFTLSSDFAAFQYLI